MCVCPPSTGLFAVGAGAGYSAEPLALPARRLHVLVAYLNTQVVQVVGIQCWVSAHLPFLRVWLLLYLDTWTTEEEADLGPFQDIWHYILKSVRVCRVCAGFPYQLDCLHRPLVCTEFQIVLQSSLWLSGGWAGWPGPSDPEGGSEPGLRWAAGPAPAPGAAGAPGATGHPEPTETDGTRFNNPASFTACKHNMPRFS